MKPRHHASDGSLLAYAAGALAPGAALVVAAHLETCPQCSAETRFLESVGGAMLEVQAPMPLTGDALETALAALDAPAPPSRRRQAAIPALPRALAHRRRGRWRWAGPGLRVAVLDDAGGRGECVYLLKARAGTLLPHHAHRGVERVLVLQGAFVDGTRYGAGDLIETGTESGGHQPAVTADGECLCLIATEGRLRFTGAARWLQPFLGV